MNDSLQLALVEIVKRTDIDPDRLEKFLSLQVQMENRQAERAYYAALASFQGECPAIEKNKKVSFVSKSGSTTKYDYTPIEEIVRVIKPFLQKYGLGYSFDVKKSETPGLVNIITTISHKDGFKKEHSYESEELHDDTRMGTIQRRKAALTFNKRASLENALGLVTVGEDDNAQAMSSNDVTRSQLEEIEKLVISTKSNKEAFLKYLKVEKLEDLTEYEAGKALIALKQKRAQNV
jgi:hypothetical protein